MGAKPSMPATFPPVNRCIYCGADGSREKLKREHIIAFSLGGHSVLPRSSCAKCEAVTSYIDGVCARSLFNDFRVHGNLPTRRPKERPTHLRLGIDRAGKAWQEISVMPSARTILLAMPEFLPPGICQDDPSLADQQTVRMRVLYDHIAVGTNVRFTNNPPVFGRMLAKIAHSTAFACEPSSILNYELLLPKIILGQCERIFYYIGGCQPFDTGMPILSLGKDIVPIVHSVQVGIHQRIEDRLLFVRIKLFSNLDTPSYEVIVGRQNLKLN